MPIAFQVIGWHHNIRPACRKSENRSDGAIFSRQVWAKEYAKQTMYDYEIRPIENPTGDDVDYLIRANIWKPADYPTEPNE